MQVWPAGRIRAFAEAALGAAVDETLSLYRDSPGDAAEARTLAREMERREMAGTGLSEFNPDTGE